MLFREIIPVRPEIRMEHKSTLCGGKNVEFLHAAAGDTYGYHRGKATNTLCTKARDLYTRTYVSCLSD
jgi:hypothetical protein